MAALAAGVATSMAQNVYSLNIVGYANVPNGAGYNFLKAPFQVTTAVTNGANEILPANTGQYDGDQVQVWTGHSWAASYLDSTQPTGFSDSGGGMVPAPILGNFQGFLYYNASGVSNNLTFVGQVPTGTNTVNIPSSPEFTALGAYTPFAGGVSTALQFTNPGGAIDGDAILLMVVVGGVPKGYTSSYFDSTQTTGFSDSGGGQLPEPQIAVGQGFLLDNVNGTPLSWTQIFNP
jgi:hypothetical protein